jgi:methionine sulfoxide reductase heme-binding subunit
MTYLKTWLPRLVHVAGLAPLLLLIADFDSVNPIQAITLRTGGVALLLLMFSLAATPLNMLFGWKWAIGLRKPLGLYAFLWMSLHFLTFTVLDYGLSWPLIQQAIVEKRYVLAGFTAFVLVVPLALTSTKGWQKRLGKNWKRLHWLVYPAAILGVLHFLWLSKDPREALLYGIVLASLLSLRLPPVRRLMTHLRPKRDLVPKQGKIEKSGT